MEGVGVGGQRWMDKSPLLLQYSAQNKSSQIQAIRVDQAGSLKATLKARQQRLMPITLATQVSEIRKIQLEASLDK
jgi:hypothetical protein